MLRETKEQAKTAEEARLDEAREKGVPWKQWGPYLSERQWGTVREDYSENGDAWNYFTHDQARSRAYHWGEDGLAGFSDDHDDLIELSAEGIARRSTAEPQADHRGRACAHIDLVVRGGLGPGLARVDGVLPAPHDAVVDPVFDIRHCVGRRK